VALTLALLLSVSVVPVCNAATLSLRSLRAPVVSAPVVHTSLAKSSSQAVTNKSSADANFTAASVSNESASANGTQPFRLSSYTPAIGKVFALYYSTMSGQKVTQIEARYYNALAQPPSDPVVFDPATGQALARGDCKLRLKSHTAVMSDMRKYNLRMAEVAVCQQFFGNPCGGTAKGCEIEMFAPLPYSSDQEKYIGAGMALTAHSVLCAQNKEAWQRDSCAIIRNKAAIAAGLQQSGTSITLRPIPGEWTDLKLDATYELGFKEAVFATSNEADYHESTHYEKKHDPLAWQRAPPEPVFCSDLACLIAKFEQR